VSYIASVYQVTFMSYQQMCDVYKAVEHQQRT